MYMPSIFKVLLVIFLFIDSMFVEENEGKKEFSHIFPLYIVSNENIL